MGMPAWVRAVSALKNLAEHLRWGVLLDHGRGQGIEGAEQQPPTNPAGTTTHSGGVAARVAKITSEPSVLPKAIVSSWTIQW
jgi:hypothetical protein